LKRNLKEKLHYNNVNIIIEYLYHDKKERVDKKHKYVFPDDDIKFFNNTFNGYKSDLTYFDIEICMYSGYFKLLNHKPEEIKLNKEIQDIYIKFIEEVIISDKSVHYNNDWEPFVNHPKYFFEGFGNIKNGVGENLELLIDYPEDMNDYNYLINYTTKFDEKLFNYIYTLCKNFDQFKQLIDKDIGYNHITIQIKVDHYISHDPNINIVNENDGEGDYFNTIIVDNLYTDIELTMEDLNIIINKKLLSSIKKIEIQILMYARNIHEHSIFGEYAE
jgi:hypothetical protein